MNTNRNCSRRQAEPRSLIRLEGETRAILTLSEPGRLNSLTAGLVLQLHARLTQLAADLACGASSSPARIPHSRQAATRDDRDRLEGDPESTEPPTRQRVAVDPAPVRRRRETIAGTDKAFIAAVNGPAAGVSLAHRPCCDIIVASDAPCSFPPSGA